ncbi:hypothetical protein CHUAL_000415 [Chamberlinius hualienensis]
MANLTDSKAVRYSEIKKELKRKMKLSNARKFKKTLLDKRLEKSLHSKSETSLSESFMRQRILLALNKSLADNVQRCRIENRELTNRLNETEILFCEIKMSNTCLKEQYKKIQTELKVKTEKCTYLEKLVSEVQNLISCKEKYFCESENLDRQSASHLELLFNGSAELNQENTDEAGVAEQSIRQQVNYSPPTEPNTRTIFNMTSITEELLDTPNSTIIDRNTTILSILGDDSVMEESEQNIMEVASSNSHKDMEHDEATNGEEVAVLFDTNCEKSVDSIKPKDHCTTPFKELEENQVLSIASICSSEYVTADDSIRSEKPSQMYHIEKNQELAIQHTDDVHIDAISNQIENQNRDENSTDLECDKPERKSRRGRSSACSKQLKSNTRNSNREFALPTVSRRTRSTNRKTVDTGDTIDCEKNNEEEICEESGKVEIENVMEVVESVQVEEEQPKNDPDETFSVDNPRDRRMTYTVVKVPADTQVSTAAKSSSACKSSQETTTTKSFDFKMPDSSKAFNMPGKIHCLKLPGKIPVFKFLKSAASNLKSNKTNLACSSKTEPSQSVSTEVSSKSPSSSCQQNAVLNSTNLNIEDMEFTVSLSVPIILNTLQQVDDNSTVRKDVVVEPSASVVVEPAASVEAELENPQAKEILTPAISHVLEDASDKENKSGENNKREKSKGYRCSKKMKILHDVNRDSNQISSKSDALEQVALEKELATDVKISEASNLLDKENVFQFTDVPEASTSRRQRKPVNYAEPNLMRKLRRP